MKGQAVRLLDVFILGPFMIWAAGRLQAPALARGVLALAGVLTVTYNGANYLRERDRAVVQRP